MNEYVLAQQLNLVFMDTAFFMGAMVISVMLILMVIILIRDFFVNFEG